jgi:hypothetical protein
VFYNNGGINTIWSTATTRIINNTIAKNERGVFSQHGGTVLINNIISQNIGYGVLGSITTNRSNDVWGNGSDNIFGTNGFSLDPVFVDVEGYDFMLKSFSPCVSSGDTASEYLDPDGTPADMGALRYVDYPPSSAILISPAMNSSIGSSAPTFVWTAAIDLNPDDSITYRLILAADSNFAFTNVIDSIVDTSYTFPGGLDLRGLVWWKVEATDFRGNTSTSIPSVFSTFLAGDANGSGTVNIADVVFLINMIFGGGPSPDPLFLGDVDRTCTVNIGDVTYLISHIFSNGPAPVNGCM